MENFVSDFLQLSSAITNAITKFLKGGLRTFLRF